MMDLRTIERWIERAGFGTKSENASTVRVIDKEAADLPPLYVQLAEHWVLLSMLPMIPLNAYRPEDLGRRLLQANRQMHVLKFAIDAGGDVVLCAELPTESLDEPELVDALKRIVETGRKFDKQLAAV